MKNKLVIMCVLIAVLALLTACDNHENESDTTRVMLKERFDIHYIGERAGMDYVIVDNETGCCYLFIRDGDGGGLCPMYNADGTMMLWDGE